MKSPFFIVSLCQADPIKWRRPNTKNNKCAIYIEMDTQQQIFELDKKHANLEGQLTRLVKILAWHTNCLGLILLFLFLVVVARVHQKYDVMRSELEAAKQTQVVKQETCQSIEGVK